MGETASSLSVHPDTLAARLVRCRTSNLTLFEDLVVFYPLLCACSSRSPRATTIKHHERGLTLVFGSDGQVSLIGFDGGVASQPPGIFPTLTESVTVAPTPGTHFLPSETTSFSPIPNREATSASLTATSSSLPTFISTFTSFPSLASSSHDPLSSSTDTDTNLPSIPTVSYPTPSPTAVSNPKDYGIGAPFYLAIVLASLSFIGCVSAFIAWWIRSRARKRDLELDDPWHRLSDSGSPFTDNANEFGKGPHTDLETQRPYYLPASIVRRSSSNLLPVPLTSPTSEEATKQNGIPHAALAAGRYPSFHRANEPRPRPNPYRNVPSLQPSRPDTVRLETGLSVQESTRTLGRLRVANRVPGDVTSGDEGGMNMSRLHDNAGPLPVADAGGPSAASVGESALQSPHLDQSDRSVLAGNEPLEPPGPATFSWGRRTDTVAALRRSRLRTPETTVQTFKNPKYGGYWYPTLDGGASTTQQVPAATSQEDHEKVPANPSSDPLDWKYTLKSSFWQAVDAMTGSRPSDPEARIANVGGGSRFTPAPQRVASRRSPVSPTHLATGSSPPNVRIPLSQEVESTHVVRPPEKSGIAQETLQSSTRLRSGDSSTRTNELEASRNSEDSRATVGSLLPRVSHLNRDLGATTPLRPPDSVKTYTGSVYSTDSAAARANLRKYGYGDSIPSTWSNLGARRESQLDLDRTPVPLRVPTPGSSRGPLSITPSQLTLDSNLQSGSVSMRTGTSIRSGSDVVGSDDGTSRSGKDVNTMASYGESSSYMSRNGTMQSSSTTSSMISRKKGVTKRKRPRPPLRAPSTASSVQSMESGLSIREVAVRRALLERRKKVKAAESLKSREGSIRSRDASSFLV